MFFVPRQVVWAAGDTAAQIAAEFIEGVTFRQGGRNRFQAIRQPFPCESGGTFLGTTGGLNQSGFQIFRQLERQRDHGLQPSGLIQWRFKRSLKFMEGNDQQRHPEFPQRLKCWLFSAAWPHDCLDGDAASTDPNRQ